MRGKELRERLWRRYREIREPWMRWVLRVQDEALSALRDFLRVEGFVEILAPIVGPVTDPGIRGAKQFSIDYYGHRFKVMSSMILYKQMAVSSLDKVFALSPNLRLEPLEAAYTGRHLAEFRQLDLEVAEASYLDLMELGERLLIYVLRRIRRECGEELENLGRELRIPSKPFRRLTHGEAVELLRGEGFDLKPGEEIPWEAEEHISAMFQEPLWIMDYPITARGFYDREDPERPGILRDFDLLYPEGYGEAISGGEREYQYERVLARMKARGDNPEEYGWYLEMLREGVKPSAGFGIGVERLTRYLCGLKYIWDAVPFPKVPGIPSP
ncbi:MAG: asparaginyl-tRNA synthetase [Candidatus Bathyarchaeota archaeon B23]|nr:MAG: asparaginyl-tRNA synthetase [Candidatus Bathyarchaeota archaeon B23]